MNYDKTHARTVIAAVDIPARRFVNRAGGLGGPGVLGVSEDSGGPGDSITVITGYSAPVEAAEAIQAGDSVASDDQGRAIVTQGVGVGIAESNGIAGKAFEVRIAPGGIPAEDLVRAPRDEVTGKMRVSSIGAGRQKLLAKCPAGHLQISAGYGGYTSHIQTVLETHAKAVYIALPNLSTSAPATGMKISVAVHGAAGAANSAESKGEGLTYFPGSFAGSPTVDIPVAESTTRPTWVLSDRIPLETIERTDSGVLELLNIRISGTPGEHATWFGGMSVLSDETATRGRIWRGYRSNAAGDYTASSTGFAAASGNAVVGHHGCIVIYETEIAGRTEYVIGDSIYLGAGSGVALAGHGWAAQSQMSISRPDLPVELCNLGWSGQGMGVYQPRFLDVLPFIPPGIVIFAGFTPNAALNAAAITVFRTLVEQARDAAADHGHIFVCGNGLPRNALVADGGIGGSAAATVGIEDLKRLLWNAELETLVPYVINLDVVAKGGIVSSGSAIGQVEYVPGGSLDGLHPNDYLNAILSIEASRTVSPLL